MLIEAGCGDAGWGKWKCNDFQALWCATDNTAGYVLLAMQERGVSHPQEQCESKSEDAAGGVTQVEMTFLFW